MKKLFFCLLIALVPAFVIVQDSCTKVSAQKPAAAAISCTDSSGVYTPSVVTSFNAGTVTFNPAHFIRICNEVYVSGSLSASNAFDTAQSSVIQVSVPFASTFNGGQNECGQALIGFNGNAQPTMGSIGFVHLVPQTGVVINWKPVKKNVYGLIYYFTYTIK